MIDILNYNLLHNNTFGISECCRRFIQFDTTEELKDVLRTLTDDDKPLLIIGGGSNLLLTQYYDGTVIRSNIKGIELLYDNNDHDAILLRCGSGETFDDIVAYAVSHGMYGAENLSIIPGDVGASAVQNIGAYGREAKDIIYKIEAVRISDGREQTFTNADCQYAYRDSRFKHEWKGQYVITHVTYRLSKTFTPYLDYGNIKAELQRRNIDTPTAQQLRDIIIDIRNAKLPDWKVEGNAGSFFMNPIVSRQKYEELISQYPQMPHYHIDDTHEKIPAAWLIDQCGWKGKTLGKAGVHHNQALVIVNRGGADGKDIVTISDAIRHDVKQHFDIDIFPEVNFV